MREVKFRAWDKRSKFMFYNVQNGITFDDGSHYKFSDFLEDTDRWEIMQYTGLKDRNGTPIFEGDVVRAIAEEKHSEMTIVSDVLCNTDDSGEWQVRMNQLYSHGLPVTWGGWESLEVLGNIYEHSHLLDNNDQND